MAGESARDVARRRREKAERLARQADLWERGAAGEEATGALLDALRAEGWHTWHDVAWPGRPRANIDHVLIGPGGVFVVDSKNWRGTITVNDEMLRQNGRRRESAVTGAAEAALAITRAMGDLPTTGVLCFVRDEPITGWARDVMLCSTGTIVDLVKSRPPTLHASAVGRYAKQLDRVLVPAGVPLCSVTRTSREAAPSEARLGVDARKTAKRGGGVKPWRLLAAVAIMVGAVMLAWSLASNAWEELTGIHGQKAHDLRETASLERRDDRPPLEVTVTKVKRTVPQGEAAPIAAGHRMVAVHLTIANTGKSAWLAPRQVSVKLDTDPAGTLSPDLTPGRVKAGRLLAAKPTIKPGKTQRRVVVFEVPKGSKPVGVLVQLDDLYDEEFRWIL